MVGIKGRSGRPPQDLWQLKQRVIKQAWNVTDEVLHTTTNGKPCAEAITIGGQIAVKDMVQKESTEHRLAISDEDRAILEKYMTPARIENKKDLDAV
jgi:hypothetical protein